ncbi:MAG TPA: hypothetical protein VN688_10625 [Gemmataceae bacterium]|nr:hypothetical protein [Gemmataceae bacterium]
MTDSDIRAPLRPEQPTSWNADTKAGQPDVRTMIPWGLVSFLIGSTFLMTWVVGVPNGLLSSLSLAGNGILTLVSFSLSLASLRFGVRGWRQARAIGSSRALAVAGVMASVASLIVWLLIVIELFAFFFYPFSLKN